MKSAWEAVVANDYSCKKQIYDFACVCVKTKTQTKQNKRRKTRGPVVRMMVTVLSATFNNISVKS
jgi:hypothetical protein